MIETTTDFFVSEDGAVTVDWVVLTAAVIGLGMIVITPVAYSTEGTAQLVATAIVNVPVGAQND